MFERQQWKLLNNPCRRSGSGLLWRRYTVDAFEKGIAKY